MQRAGMKSFARARSMRFDWQKLVTPVTPKAVVADFQAKASELNTMQAKAQSVAQTVDPINWDEWKAKIQTPGVVEQMQKEYEALNFPVKNAMTPETEAKIAAIEADVLTAKKAAILGASELKETEKVIGTVNKVKAEGLDWSLEQWHAFIPGLEEQHKAEYENEDYLVPANQLKFDAVDWKQAGAEFVDGTDPDIGDVDEKIGDMCSQEEIDLVNEGKWSVARLFASKEERARISERTEKLLASAQ